MIVTIGDVRWAFACKMMMGASPVSLFDRIEDGLEQIERVAVPKGPVQRGVVVISLKNRFDHNEFWPILNSEQYAEGEPPIFGVQPDAMRVAARLRDLAVQEMKAMEEISTFEKVAGLFRNSASSPAVLLFLQASMSLPSSLGPIPSIYTLLQPYLYGDVKAEDATVFSSMYDAIHNRAVAPTS